MTDATQATDEYVPQPYKVPVVKGKDSIEIDVQKLPDAVYREVIAQGLKYLINSKMSKITKTTYPKPEELIKAAMAKAAEVADAMLKGTIRIAGAKSASKVSGKVMTEARRIARNMVKDEMKRQGIKVSYVAAKDITAAANSLIADNPDIIKEAEASLAAQAEKASTVANAIAGIAKSIPIDAKKKAAVEAKKAEAKQQLSAAQAGKVKQQTKPQATA